MSAQNKPSSADKKALIRNIIIGVLIVAVIILVATGKLDLNSLIGGLLQNQPQSTQSASESNAAYVTYKFRNKTLLDQHYDKHGKDMGFKSAADYEKAACDVINNPAALHKIEKEDGDYVYYVQATNEFVILSTDGYIRTYFLPDSGYAYYQRQ